MLALREDQVAARRAIVNRHAELNACTLSSRLLIEAAICECPLNGGRIPGDLDVSRLMANVLLVFHFGGWSDAMRWGAMESRVKITPLGDIHANHDFLDGVFKPFSIFNSEVRVQDNADEYGENYEPFEAAGAIGDKVEQKFSLAWKSEFGVAVDEIPAFISHIEESAIAASQAIIEFSREKLVELLKSGGDISNEDANCFLDAFTLRTREEWQVAPLGFEKRDWQPWRFRRRLSVYRRPLLQLEAPETSSVLIAPGILRQAFALTLSSFHRGDIPEWQIMSREMRSWVGHANRKRGLAFNELVARKMEELGWQVWRETKPTRITGGPLDRDYGDIDVLAWKPELDRVLIMECKDVHYKKTFGEVAEQLSDFRGEFRPDGERDLLKKHLDRIELLKGHQPKIVQALSLRPDIQIEGHLVFRHPVPMRFAWEHMANRIKISVFDGLDQL
jgi:hypothetical protein